MTTRKLEPSEWQPYFDEVAEGLPSMQVGAGTLSSVEVIARDDTKQIVELRPLPSLPVSWLTAREP